MQSDVTISASDYKLLPDAVKDNYITPVRALLEIGAFSRKNLDSLLVSAVELGHVEISRNLVDYGASVSDNARNTYCNN